LNVLVENEYHYNEYEYIFFMKYSPEPKVDTGKRNC
jgi:hypothetical protein